MDDAEQRDYEAYLAGRVLALRRTAYRLCGDWDTAQDLVQDTAVALYLHWGRASGADSRDAYVQRMLVNAYLSQVRRPWYRRILSSASPPETPVREPDHDGRLDLRAALDRLSAGQRTVLVLRYWEGMDVAGTAATMGCSVGTVKSQTAAAIGRLRRILPEYVSESQQSERTGVFHD